MTAVAQAVMPPGRLHHLPYLIHLPYHPSENPIGRSPMPCATPRADETPAIGGEESRDSRGVFAGRRLAPRNDPRATRRGHVLGGAAFGDHAMLARRKFAQFGQALVLLDLRQRLDCAPAARDQRHSLLSLRRPAAAALACGPDPEPREFPGGVVRGGIAIRFVVGQHVPGDRGEARHPAFCFGGNQRSFERVAKRTSRRRLANRARNVGWSRERGER